jgi:hypothetical protein
MRQPQRKSTPTSGQGDTTSIQWLQRGEFTKILGAPHWSEGADDAFWHTLYQKIKKRIASWEHHSHLTIHGRVHLINLIVYGIPRYWAQSSTPPAWFEKALKKDVKRLLWEREIDTDTQTIFASTIKKAWIIEPALYNPRSAKGKSPHSLGIGLLDWEAHTAAIRILWLLKYRDGREAPWKLVLDQWLKRTYLGRGALFSTLSVDALTQHISENLARHKTPSNIPQFWVQALLDLKAIGLTPITTSRDGALAQPIWYNPQFNLPPAAIEYKEAWEELQGHTLDNMVHDSMPYTDGELESFLTPSDKLKWKRDLIHIRLTFSNGEKATINTTKLFKSWHLARKAIPPHLKSLLTSPEQPPDLTNDREKILISPTSKEWFVIQQGQCHSANKNDKGQLITTGNPPVSAPQDLTHAARWGHQYIDTRRECFPLPSDYSLGGSKIRLDKLTIKSSTNIISYKGRKPPNALKAWKERVDEDDPIIKPNLDWEKINKIYKTDFLSPKDYHLHFRHLPTGTSSPASACENHARRADSAGEPQVGLLQKFPFLVHVSHLK